MRTEEIQSRRRKQGRIWLALIFILILLAIATVPPLISVSRYKNQITGLISASLGRPVRLSSVEMRILPRPGFVLTDLVVEEDAGFGAEPVLHAETVTASIRMLSLWRGRLEIGRISVDNASLNLVREPDGRWNLDPLFRTAAARSQSGANAPRKVPLPYLEATNSRINIKNGAEKLPYSLVSTDLSFWQEEPGDWRIRLRGQPARTDVSLDLADTGIVRLEASMRKAPELREMPVHLDLEWSEAQLGQLTRLLVGSDPGWRGDLTGELHLDGTADAAHIKTRLRAIGVHRAEFAPASPMDFDANCDFSYHFSSRTLDGVACDSPLGDGSIHLAGKMGSGESSPQFSVELNKIPVAAGLDALRTVRSDIVPGLEVKGLISGKITYLKSLSASNAPGAPAMQARAGRTHPKPAVAPSGPLTGSLTLEGFQLGGDGMKTPIEIPSIVIEPSASPLPAAPGAIQPLAATFGVPAGGAAPLSVTVRMTVSGYDASLHGQASVARVREWAHLSGMKQASALDALAGDPILIDLRAGGPWIATEKNSLEVASAAGSAVDAKPRGNADANAADHLDGTLTLRNANWKADYLANHVEISTATVHFGGDDLVWDPVVFSYGPVKGSASLTLSSTCPVAVACVSQFQVHFGDLNAGALRAALLGAQEPNTMLSTLIARLTPASNAAVWPQLEGTVTADSFDLSIVKLQDLTASLKTSDHGVEITSLDAKLLGGDLHGTGSVHAAVAGSAKPSYGFEGTFEKVNPLALGQMLGQHWSGGTMNGSGKIELQGFSDKELASSAKGSVHFEWRHGSIAGEESRPPDQSEIDENDPTLSAVPAVLLRFDRWVADGVIGDGSLKLQTSSAWRNARQTAVAGALTFGYPVSITWSAPKEATARR